MSVSAGIEEEGAGVVRAKRAARSGEAGWTRGTGGGERDADARENERGARARLTNSSPVFQLYLVAMVIQA